MAELLLHAGSDINTVDDDAWTPLMLSALSGWINRKYIGIIRFFFHIVYFHNRFLGQNKLVEFLIRNNANVTLQNKHGNTPLHCAIEKGHLKAVEILLPTSNISIKNKANLTAFCKAKKLRKYSNNSTLKFSIGMRNVIAINFNLFQITPPLKNIYVPMVRQPNVNQLLKWDRVQRHLQRNECQLTIVVTKYSGIETFFVSFGIISPAVYLINFNNYTRLHLYCITVLLKYSKIYSNWKLLVEFGNCFNGNKMLYIGIKCYNLGNRGIHWIKFVN